MMAFLNTLWILVLLQAQGWYCSPVCVLCPPGEGATSCTQCVTCPEGYYSPKLSQDPCQPCSICDQFSFISLHCTNTHDVMCQSCDDVIGSHGNIRECKEKTMHVRQIRDISDGTGYEKDALSESLMTDILQRDHLIPNSVHSNSHVTFSTRLPRDVSVDDLDMGSGVELAAGVIYTDVSQEDAKTDKDIMMTTTQTDTTEREPSTQVIYVDWEDTTAADHTEMTSPDIQWSTDSSTDLTDVLTSSDDVLFSSDVVTQQVTSFTEIVDLDKHAVAVPAERPVTQTTTASVASTTTVVKSTTSTPPTQRDDMFTSSTSTTGPHPPPTGTSAKKTSSGSQKAVAVTVAILVAMVIFVVATVAICKWKHHRSSRKRKANGKQQILSVEDKQDTQELADLKPGEKSLESSATETTPLNIYEDMDGGDTLWNATATNET